MSESFAALFEESLKRSEMRSGEVITAEVVRIDHNHVVVNAGLKSEAYVPLEEFKNDLGELEVQVGDFVSVDYDDDNRVATYLFIADIAGYRGWRWCITIAKVDEDAQATVCDVVILPGPDSLLAPDHIPYMERILPEDIQPGVIVPSILDDTRLAPGVHSLIHDEELDPMPLLAGRSPS